MADEPEFRLLTGTYNNSLIIGRKITTNEISFAKKDNMYMDTFSEINFSAGTSNAISINSVDSSHLNAGLKPRLTIDSDGKVGIGTPSPNGKLQVNDDNYGILGFGGTIKDLWFDGGNDSIFWLKNIGAPGGRTSFVHGTTELMAILNNGNVGIGTPATGPEGKLDVRGDIRAGNSDIYFTKTDHNHTGTIGNTSGYAAIENAASHGALMILGRSGTTKGRYVRLWDYLQVNGGMDITGNVGIGTQEPSANLTVRGEGSYRRVYHVVENIPYSIRVRRGYMTQSNCLFNDTNDPRSSFDVGDQIIFGRETGTVQYTEKNLAILKFDHNFIYDDSAQISIWHGSLFVPSTVFKVIGDKGEEKLSIYSDGIARFAGNITHGGSCTSSSKELKENIDNLSAQEAFEAFEKLNPVKFNLKTDNEKRTRVGFIAEDVSDIVSSSDRKAIINDHIVAILTKVIKEQQKAIKVLTDSVEALKNNGGAAL